MPKTSKNVQQLKPRGTRRTTNTGYSHNDIESVMNLVLLQNVSECKAARSINIPHKTLNRYIAKYKAGCLIDELITNRASRTIFSKKMKTVLKISLNSCENEFSDDYCCCLKRSLSVCNSE